MGPRKSWHDIFTRVGATFVQGTAAAPVAAVALDMAWWKAQAVAGIIAVIGLLHRASQRWLSAHPEV